jgi:hypothetical protein
MDICNMYMLATIMKVITKMIKILHKDTKKKTIFLIKFHL